MNSMPEARCQMVVRYPASGIRHLASFILLVVVSTLILATRLQAADYYFFLPRVEMDLDVRPDSTVALSYDMDFENTDRGHPIDIVDVGMPHEKYEISSMQASINGNALSDIRPSEVVHPGVEVHLGSNTIPAEGFGNFRFNAKLDDLVYQDTTREDLASLQITPTWFGDAYVAGTTKLTIKIRLPEGIKLEDALFQDVEFSNKVVEEGRIVVSWYAERRFTGPFRVGVSFPKRNMTGVIAMSRTELLLRWYKGAVSPEVRLVLFGAAVIFLGVIFFRFTGGTGCFLFAALLVGMYFFYLNVDVAELLIWPILLVVGAMTETARRDRKSKYLPAMASVEGGGIKRGLTAPEAAVLLELPVNKVTTMILFGMLKKGLIEQTAKDPVSFVPAKNPSAEAVIQPYEKEFLDEFKSRPDRPIEEYNFGPDLERLVKSMVARMKGFDVEETKSYYKSIVSRAWREAQVVGDVQAWQNTMDEKVDWMMLDPNFGPRFRPYEDRYVPRSFRIGTFGGGVSRSSTTPSSVGPRFSDFAGSVSGWLQNTAGSVVSHIEGTSGGVLNLGSMDKGILKALESSGSSGSGGGGGGCACACAGCACACACAGGGR